MTKGASEGQVRAALSSMDLLSIVYKPPDDARNWKPCDFMVWWASSDGPQCAWLEVKDTPAKDVFALSQIRQSQRLGIVQAHEVGIPYLLVVHWSRWKLWTISDAWAVMESAGLSATRLELMTRYGVDAQPRDLASTLRVVLLEGLT